MTYCQSCGAHVSDRFARVCGDNDGRVWNCPECTSGCQDRHLRQTAPPQ
ncbi:DUF7563 family protein [Natronoarchaeum rubrum]